MLLPDAKKPTPEQFALFQWFYEKSGDGSVAAYLFGMCLATATDHPTETYWEIVRRVKARYEEVHGRTA